MRLLNATHHWCLNSYDCSAYYVICCRHFVYVSSPLFFKPSLFYILFFCAFDMNICVRAWATAT